MPVPHVPYWRLATAIILVFILSIATAHAAGVLAGFVIFCVLTIAALITIAATLSGIVAEFGASQPPDGAPLVMQHEEQECC